ncbi:VPLPA-CTERM protein sorting domain-containing protein [Ruegeria halocynthiae]|uniref:VPLPA-CTERM protein sorting domain-containing protein n=1 Tax=Ruegeria halocynthiae TaxID=985054 RepID=A0A1H2T5T4_9RHOB|nr:VPLPA-CTERM protein sorting domain-containing protein [Ruegeria halocynthiae]
MGIKSIAAAMCLTVLGTGASAATLNATDNFLDFRFSVPSQPASHNAIQFSFDTVSRIGSLTGIASLYDGTTLLASHTVTDLLGGRFFDPASFFASVPFGTSTDYSSVADGTIDGRFTFLVTSTSAGAAYNFDLADLRVRTFGDSGNLGSDGSITERPTITSVTIAPVPLPASVLMLMGALLGLAGLQRMSPKLVRTRSAAPA